MSKKTKDCGKNRKESKAIASTFTCHFSISRFVQGCPRGRLQSLVFIICCLAWEMKLFSFAHHKISGRLTRSWGNDSRNRLSEQSNSSTNTGGVSVHPFCWVTDPECEDDTRIWLEMPWPPRPEMNWIPHSWVHLKISLKILASD